MTGDIDRDAIERNEPALLRAHDALRAAADEPVPDGDETWARIEARLDETPQRRPSPWRSRATVFFAAAAITISGTAIGYAASQPVRHAVDDVIEWVVPGAPKHEPTPTPAPSVSTSVRPADDHRGEPEPRETETRDRSGSDDSHEGSSSGSSGSSGSGDGDDKSSPSPSPSPSEDHSGSDSSGSGSGSDD